MAAQTAEQKAAAQADAERVAAEQRAAEQEAEQAAAEAPVDEPKRRLVAVTGPAVVLVTTDGPERYLYRKAIVDASGFTEASVEHAVSIGLIEIVK